MQTGAIGYRVADFLKEHPPFQGIEEQDLLSLVARGRVKFYESDGFLCWQDAAFAPFVFVVQQGAVSLWETTNGSELLRDICGPGDVIGMERFLGSKCYPYSAKANGDVVAYALPADDFKPLLDRYPHVARYVESHSSVGAVYRDTDRAGVHEIYVVELARHPVPLSCSPDAPVTEAARILQTAEAEALSVMRDHELLGIITARDIIAWVAGEAPLSRVAADIMRAVPPLVAPQTSVSDCVLAMSRAQSSFAALTTDGTDHGGLLRLVSASDLQPAFGDNPLTILQDVTQAPDVEVLRVLNARFRALLLAQLTNPSAVDWLAALAQRFNIAVAKRLIELAGTSVEYATWCFWGAAGRCELLAPVEPQIALLCRDAADVERGSEALQRLRMDLAACDYLPYPPPECGEMSLCATVESWQERFARWIHDPVLSGMYAARPFFDLQPGFGDADLYRQLEQSVCEDMNREPSFRRVLANDCLSALPPLTFFEGAVVEESGQRSDVFELEQRALVPVVEVGRVFAQAKQAGLGSSTMERLRATRERLPEKEKIFRDAMETLSVLLYLEARTGLRLHTSGAEILPSQLSRLDRQALKSGFRTIHNLLEFTFEHLWVNAS